MVPLPRFAAAPRGRRAAGAFPPLRVSAGEGEYATPGPDPGDGGGGAQQGGSGVTSLRPLPRERGRRDEIEIQFAAGRD